MKHILKTCLKIKVVFRLDKCNALHTRKSVKTVENSYRKWLWYKSARLLKIPMINENDKNKMSPADTGQFTHRKKIKKD